MFFKKRKEKQRSRIKMFMLPPSPFTMSCATKTQLNTGGARCVFSFLFFFNHQLAKISSLYIYSPSPCYKEEKGFSVIRQTRKQTKQRHAPVRPNSPSCPELSIYKHHYISQSLLLIRHTGIISSRLSPPLRVS